MFAPFVAMFMIPKWVIPKTTFKQALHLKIFPAIGCAPCVE